MSIARHHAEWLSLLEISGPFLSLPVLLRVFPQGLDEDDPEHRRELRLAYEEWLDNQGGLSPDPAIHRAWVRYVLIRTLQLPEEVIAESQAIPPTLKATIAEQQETLRPDLAVLDPDNHQPRLLIQIVPPSQDLDKPLAEHHWKASPATRIMELLHACNVRLGLVTNGEQWLLVNAPRGETTGFISWYAELWLEEKITVRAFRSLLGVHRFFSVPAAETLEAMLAQSQDEQHEVTDQLGYQVRRAVEVLVQAIDLADRDGNRRLLVGVSEAELYEAALTVMMRLVFLFSAEERGLFPLDDELYNQYYAASTLREQLREAADQQGEEVIERRLDAWSRLLTAFRAIHAGIEHDRLRLPAYGGSLFDPDKFEFLEGRLKGSSWLDTRADPLPINNRTVLHLLEALQLLQVRVPGGGPAEARRLSFRALDIEQIGHVYESLLDHTAVRAGEVVLGLAGTRNQEPEVALSTLELFSSGQGRNERALLDFLKEQTGRSESALRKAINNSQLDIHHSQLLRAACANDDSLYHRVLPWAGLVREDDLGQPIVILPGSVYVTAGAERRATGTHYTPRSLTEPIVQHTLEPLVYYGPAEGLPPERWRLKPPADLLALKICDMAMGSGAFLVQACRYLSERLVEAWEEVEGRGGEEAKRRKSAKSLGSSPPVTSPLLTPEGQLTTNPDEAIPADTSDRLILARRLVADRCLYGVDKNPLAVEMAKLSLWLVTLDKNRPFTFLDHALKCGDSLVGVNLDQLTTWNLAGQGKRAFETLTIQGQIDEMVTLRRQISNLPVNSVADQEYKKHRLQEAEQIANDLRQGGDLLIGSYFNDLKSEEQEYLRTALLLAFRDGQGVPPDRATQADLGNLHPFHWPLEFPEVFLAEGRSGFDAFVGNPPFIGGRRIRETLGDNYRELLYQLYPGSSGNADYSAFFFLRGFRHLQQGGALGLIATNTIAQGDTKQTGLDTILEEDGIIYNAVNNQPWPGAAAVVVNIVHVAKNLTKLPCVLDGKTEEYISSALDTRRVIGKPHPLVQNESKSHMGTNVVGLGFMMSPEEAQVLISKDARNAEILFPFINGQDLNSSPTQLASRWIINFFDWPLEKAEEFSECIKIVRERVKPQRDMVNRKVYRELWWQYAEKQKGLYQAISPLKRTLSIAQTSQTAAVVFVPTKMVFSHKVIVFAFDDSYHFAILQSAFHEYWARRYSSTLKQDLSYTPSTAFQTFPFPQSPISNLQSLETLGEMYHEHRRQIMLARQEGLTTTYNRFHNPDESAADIAHLRELHVQTDRAVAVAYGWSDLDLGHDFHETAQGVRFTISDSARREVLGRLLALNHSRYEEEVKAGLHARAKGKAKAEAKSQGSEEVGVKGSEGDVVQGRLF